MALQEYNLSQPATISSDTFRVTTSQKQDSICITLLSWITSGDFPPWIEVKGLSPELRLLWHHRNNLSVGDNGVIWQKRSSQSHMLHLLVPKPAREQLFLSYFNKWMEAFPIKNKFADTVADVLVEKITLRLYIIHSDAGREFENGLMKSLCTLLGCTKTRTAPDRPESDSIIKRFNQTCLMMVSMFINDRRDNWDELLPFVMHAYRTSVHDATGYSPFHLMMGEECSLPQDVSTSELRTNWGT